MDNERDEIDELLSSFKTQKENKERREPEPLEPPKKRNEIIDFAKLDEPEAEQPSDKNQKLKKAPKPKKAKKPKKTFEEREQAKAERKEKLSRVSAKIKGALKNKKVYTPLILIFAVIVIICGTVGAVNYSKTAYLRPYQKEYPDVTFPVGIMEKYCDAYGKNSKLVGFVQLNEGEDRFIIENNKAQILTEGATRFNHVIYLDTDALEKTYSTIDGYNNSSKAITYTDLLEDYYFEVLGAFYTNTKAEDDDGYIFPYNTTEKMTHKSFNQYADRINSRLIYKTNDSFDKEDILLTISCPTDYRENYRFVVICKQVEEIKPNLKATKKENYHLTQKEYDEKGILNPYRFASKWYPEIIITDEKGNETTIQRDISYYEK